MVTVARNIWASIIEPHVVVPAGCVGTGVTGMGQVCRSDGRAAYIYLAEHLDERRLMLQWWADFLDANREKAVSPFDIAKRLYK